MQCIIDSSINVSMGKRGERGGAGALACVVGCVVDFQFHTHRWMSAFYRLTHLSAKCHPELTPVQSVPAAIFITCAVIKMYFLPMCSLMGSIRSCSRGGHSRTSLPLTLPLSLLLTLSFSLSLTLSFTLCPSLSPLGQLLSRGHNSTSSSTSSASSLPTSSIFHQKKKC